MKNFTVKSLNAAILLTFLLLFQLTVFAQEQQQLFNPISTFETTLSADDELRLSNQETNPVYKNTQLIQVGVLTDFLSGRYLTFNIPDEDITYTAQVKEFEFESSVNYKWRGELIDYEGRIVLFNENGNVFGHIVVEGQEYSIQSIGKESVFLEYDMDLLLQQKCGNEDNANEEPPQPDEGTPEDGERSVNSCTGLVRILVLYTSAAQQAANVQNVATTSISQTNTGFGNSAVPYGDVHVSKASVQYLNFTETTDPFDDVDRLKINSTAQSLRNQYQADLVILLTDANYTGVAGIVAEIGPINNAAYAIVEVDYATGNLTFAHEAAHLFGCRHQNDPNGTYQHGYYFTKGWWFWTTYHRTIMGTDNGLHQRIQHYSNPDVTYNGKSTGTSNSNDNARKLEVEGCTVENFRPFDPPPSVNISGPATGNNSGTYTWTASGSGGQTPYTYQWYFSLTGSNYFYVGTGSSVTAQLPLDSDLYIKVVLTDSNQEQATDYHYVFNRDAGGGGHDKSTGKDKNETDVKEGFVDAIQTLSPNPAINYTYLTLNQSIAGIVRISVIDLYGKIKLSQARSLASGISTIEINTEALENGIYFVRVERNYKYETLKLIINK